MPPFPPSPLVSTGWLAAELGRPCLVILDTSWYLPNSGRVGRAEYRDAHIPGAGYFDLDLASDGASALPHMLPSDDEFARYAGSLGVGSDSIVVVYDGSGNNLSAARVWWMFRAYGHDQVFLLDGGLKKWKAESRPVESGEVTREQAVFKARLNTSWIRNQSAVDRALSSGSAQVLDARSAGRYAGTDPEPRAGLSSGHMPGSLSLPYSELVNPDGTAISVDDLRQRLASLGVRLDRPVIASCGSGVTACNILFALHRLGHTEATLYDGSWTEWAGSGAPIATGPEPGPVG